MLRCCPELPALTVHDIGHDPAAAREQNAALVLSKLPGTTRQLAKAADIAFLAAADAVLLLVGRKQARLTDPTVYPFTYAKV